MRKREPYSTEVLSNTEEWFSRGLAMALNAHWS